MIEVTFHPNGFEINGHEQREICYQVSILAWACANTMSMNGMDSDYYTSAYDHSNAGYTHLTFDTENEKANWVFNEFKTNITHWKNEFWNDNQVRLTENQNLLVIPSDFKAKKNIITG